MAVIIRKKTKIPRTAKTHPSWACWQTRTTTVLYYHPPMRRVITGHAVDHICLRLGLYVIMLRLFKALTSKFHIWYIYTNTFSDASGGRISRSSVNVKVTGTKEFLLIKNFCYCTSDGVRQGGVITSKFVVGGLHPTERQSFFYVDVYRCDFKLICFNSTVSHNQCDLGLGLANLVLFPFTECCTQTQISPLKLLKHAYNGALWRSTSPTT